MNDHIEIEKSVVLEKVLLVAHGILDDYPGLSGNTEVILRAQQTASELAMLMKSWCLAGRIPTRTEPETVRWPNGWWQMFKEHQTPQWFRRWFPVEYSEKVVEKTTHIYFVCPHVNPGEDESLHYRFMVTGTPRAGEM